MNIDRNFFYVIKRGKSYLTVKRKKWNTYHGH